MTPSHDDDTTCAWIISDVMDYYNEDLHAQVLSRDERDRLTQFRTPELQDKWAASRVLLRFLLGASLNVAPDRVLITTTCEHCGHPEHGRPRLGERTNVHFSLSRAGRRLAVAISKGFVVGVDLEVATRKVDDLVEDFCGDDELPKEPSAEWALEAWTRKEAVLKACGKGLALPPKGIGVAKIGTWADAVDVASDRWWVTGGRLEAEECVFAVAQNSSSPVSWGRPSPSCLMG